MGSAASSPGGSLRSFARDRQRFPACSPGRPALCEWGAGNDIRRLHGVELAEISFDAWCSSAARPPTAAGRRTRVSVVERRGELLVLAKRTGRARPRRGDWFSGERRIQAGDRRSASWVCGPCRGRAVRCGGAILPAEGTAPRRLPGHRNGRLRPRQSLERTIVEQRALSPGVIEATVRASTV